MVTVRVPATTANLGPGFDTLGLALALYNTLTFEELAEGLYFEGVDPEYATAENLAVVAYKAVLSKLGLPRLTLIRTPGAVVLGMVYNYLPGPGQQRRPYRCRCRRSQCKPRLPLDPGGAAGRVQ